MKSLLLFSLTFLFGFTLFAQVNIGLQGGYVKAWEEYRRDLPDDAQIHIEGFRFGASAYGAITSALSVGIEPNYVRRGAACEPGFVFFNQDTKLKLDYVELPLNVRFQHQLLTPRLEAFVSAGYSASYLLQAQREITDLSTGEVISDDKLPMEDSNMRRWDHGVRAAGGLMYHFSKFTVLAKYDRYYGQIDVEKSFTSQNREMSITTGITMPLR